MKRIKETYLLFLIVIGLMSLALYSTYAMFTASSTINNVVSINAVLTTTSNIMEYEIVTVPVGETKIIEVTVKNSYSATLYYGAWYEILSGSSSDIDLGLYTSEDSTVSSGTISSGSTITLLVGITNKGSSKAIVNIGTVGSLSSSLGIASPRALLPTGWEPPASADIIITNITINGSTNQGLPTSDLYAMTSNCSNVSYNRLTKKVKVTDYTSSQSCILNFTSDTNYPLLNTMNVGDYVAYVGNNGCNNGTEGTIGTNAAEAGNSCLGENANQSTDTSNYTYGYCYSANYKYYVYGWRIAYIENSKVYLISAGSPECRIRTSSTGNTTQIGDLNTASLDYCNATYADGGSCSSSNTWAMGNTDFQKITNAISGTSYSLTSTYDSSNYCYGKYSVQGCGYNNDLIDNGGYYWFAAYYTSSGTGGIRWSPDNRRINNSSGTYVYGFRPIIALSSSVYVTGGTGTMEDPYTIGI